MRMMITYDATEVHSGLRLFYRAADCAHSHNYPGVNQVQKLGHLQCWSSDLSNNLTHTRQVDEARLCGPSLSTGPIALGRSQSGLNNST